MSRIEELVQLIQFYSNKYYNESISEITDAEFDKLVDELKSLGGSIDSIGAPTYGKKVTHSQRMGSLDKDTEVENIIAWAKRYSKDGKVCLTPKIDGLAVRLNYDLGKLVEAATRGDGIVGQDVTDNVKMIKNIPKTIKSKIGVEIRGEILMRRSVFNKFMEEGIEDLSNPRNAASGSLMAKDPAITGSRNLSFLCYDIVIKGSKFETELQKMNNIKSLLPEFDPVSFEVIDIDDFRQASSMWELMRPTLDFEIDGLVLALNIIAEQEEAGWTTKCPRGKLAFKFPPEQKKAKIKSIDWQVGRTGRLTPVTYIEPVSLGGSTIGKMTLHNYSIFKELNVAVGDTVLIEKAGDIIPQVVRVLERPSNRIVHSHPCECPSCNNDLVFSYAMVRNPLTSVIEKKAVNLVCNNLNCPARFSENVINFITALDLIGIGEAIITGLCEKGYIKNYADLYKVTVEQIKEITGGDKSSKKVYDIIHSKKDIPLEIFLDSLGIIGLGTSTSKEVAKKFKTLKAVRNVKSSDLVTIEGIADLTESKIINGLKSMSGIIDQLTQEVNVMDIKEATGSLVGKSFCLTGKMSKPRKEIESAIEKVGGEISSVKSGLTYLVQADSSSTSDKSEKALKLGISIISEDDLWKMIEGK